MLAFCCHWGDAMANAAPLVWTARHNSRVAAKTCPKEQEVMVRLGVFTAVIFAGMLLTAQDVNKDYDHSFDFSQLHTFAVKIGTSWGNPLSENRVKTTITDELVKRGWTQASD